MAESERLWSLGTVLLVVVILVAASAAGGYIYLKSRTVGSHQPLTVALGDNVTVNYIGVFGSGPEQGKVFDTSEYAVATNPALWPKGLEYTPRGAPANYTPLPVHIGPSTPSGGYSLGGLHFIQVVTGFWQGMIGLPGNQTHTEVVPPALGYGATNPACVATYPLVQYFPVVLTYPRSTFTQDYPGVLPQTGATFEQPHYQWPVLILSTNATSVTIENMAHVGQTANPSGWPVAVTNVSNAENGTITVVNQLTPADAGHLLGIDFAGTGPCQSQSNGKFIVTAVNPATGTYTADFNSEVTGETLLFLVTVVDILPPTVP